jgi:hypothetical protein
MELAPTAPPEPVVDQQTAIYVARKESVTDAVRQEFDGAWRATGSVHERRRIVALRDAVLRLVAEAEQSADVAHGLGLGEREAA